VRALGIDPVHGTRSTFRALCDAMARPGTLHEAPTDRADHAVVTTLVDHEVPFHTDDPDLADALAAQGRLEHADATEARIVHTTGDPSWDARTLRRGSLVEPSEGVTLVHRVDALATDPGQGLTTCRLSGPGVDGTRTVAVALPASSLEAIVDAQSTYPRGIDVVLTGGRHIAALPRSVTCALGDAGGSTPETDTHPTGRSAGEGR
jgi:alpha-D-ribose 1-methylphosphonate 5-triphosphate synthase subunit PhnH